MYRNKIQEGTNSNPNIYRSILPETQSVEQWFTLPLNGTCRMEEYLSRKDHLLSKFTLTLDDVPKSRWPLTIMRDDSLSSIPPVHPMKRHYDQPGRESEGGRGL